MNPLKYSLTTRLKDKPILRMIQPAENKRILDIGCGIGYLTGLLKDCNVLAFGIDISFDAIKYCVNNVDETFVCGDAVRLPFQDNSFDGIVIADVIEHIADDEFLLKETIRVARNDAIVVISTPALEGLFTRSWVKTLLHGEDDEFLTNRRHGYDYKSMSQLLKQSGIEISEVVYTNVFLSELFLAMCKVFYYLKKGRYNSQADLTSIDGSFIFNIYKRFIFPFLITVSRVEELLLSKLLKGHCLIVSGVVEKNYSRRLVSAFEISEK